MPLLDLIDAKIALNINGDQYDGELGDYIMAACSVVDLLCGPTDQVTVTETVTSGNGVIVLSKSPVISVTSVTGRSSGLRDSADLYTDLAAGVITALPTAARINAVDLYDVVYVAGRASVPVGLKTAAKVILKSLWSSRRGSGRRQGQGNVDDEVTGITMPGLGAPVPALAVQAMAPYRLAPSVV